MYISVFNSQMKCSYADRIGPAVTRFFTVPVKVTLHSCSSVVVVPGMASSTLK